MKKETRTVVLSGIAALALLIPSMPASAAPTNSGEHVTSSFTAPSWAQWESDWPEVGTKISLSPASKARGDLSIKWYAHLDDGSMKMVSTSREFLVPSNLSGLPLSWEAEYQDGESAGAELWSTVDYGYAKVQATCSYSGVPIVGKPFKITAVSNKNAVFPQSKPYFYGMNQTGRLVGSGSTATFTPSSSDAGKKISLDITRKEIFGKNLSGRSVEQIAFDFANCTLPAVKADSLPKNAVTLQTGKAKNPTTSRVGTVLTGTASAKAVKGQKTNYQWTRNDKPIKGATKSTYKLSAEDYGKAVSLKISRSAPGYQTSTSASKSTKVTAGASKAGQVKISGSARPGKNLTAKVTSWTTGSKLSYQWSKNGKTIKNQTKSTYKLSKADANAQIAVKVTAKRHGYETVHRTSAAVKVAKK